MANHLRGWHNYDSLRVATDENEFKGKTGERNTQHGMRRARSGMMVMRIRGLDSEEEI